MPPTLASGKLCYIEIPALDIERSAEFYSEVFGWTLRHRGGGISFDDTVGEVSGRWVTGRPASPDAGLLIYVMVADAEAAIAAVIAHGGTIVQPVGMDAPEVTARFRDPAGNVMGIYQDPDVAAAGS